MASRLLEGLFEAVACHVSDRALPGTQRLAFARLMFDKRR